MLNVEKIHLYDSEKEGKLGKFYCKKVTTEIGNHSLAIITENGGVVLDPIELFGQFIYIGVDMHTSLWYACIVDFSVLDESEANLMNLVKFADKDGLPELVQEYFDYLESGNFEIIDKLIAEYFGVSEDDMKCGKKKKYKKGTLVMDTKGK